MHVIIKKYNHEFLTNHQDFYDVAQELLEFNRDEMQSHLRSRGWLYHEIEFLFKQCYDTEWTA